MSASGDKSEKPTQGKLRKAREKGDLPRSKDMTMAAGLATAFGVLCVFLPYYRDLIGESFRGIRLLKAHQDPASAIDQFLMLNVSIFIRFMITLVPIPVACIVASLVPGGWIFTLAKLKPDIKKISPLSGVKRLFATSHFADVGKMILKCSLILGVIYALVTAEMAELLHLQRLQFMQGIHRGFSILFLALSCFIGVIVSFAVLDIPLSRFLFTKKMKMTKQEVKEEHKNNEGNPQIKGRVRQLQRQIAMGQVRKTVPDADVIITNPTHYAVALKYDPERAQAPYIVAKGVDDMARFIRETGQQHQVEIVEFPPLARAVYYTTKVNQQIPASLFRAIAHVLTYVMQIKAWRGGETAIRPSLNRHISIPKEVLTSYGKQ